MSLPLGAYRHALGGASIITASIAVSPRGGITPHSALCAKSLASRCGETLHDAVPPQEGNLEFMNTTDDFCGGNPSPPKTGCHSILVVEDDPQMLFVYRRLLGGAGYGVFVAENGEEGWTQLCLKHFDLLVTDCCMPGLSGLDLVRRIRVQNPSLPILMISGSLPEDEPGFQMLLHPGATLEKPFTVTQILENVCRLLGKWAPQSLLTPGPNCSIVTSVG